MKNFSRTAVAAALLMLTTLLDRAGAALNAADDRYVVAESTNSALWLV